LIQLHGDEDSTYIKRLKDEFDCRVIKSIAAVAALPSLPAEPDYLLFDAPSAQRGGAGKIFNWHILHGYSGLPFFLSGGLTSTNAAAAIRLLAPYCVDVSSGVETDGVKDAGKIEEFICLVRGIN